MLREVITNCLWAINTYIIISNNKTFLRMAGKGTKILGLLTNKKFFPPLLKCFE